MSYKRALTLWLEKERFDEVRQSLNPAQRTERQPLHFVLVLHEALRDLALHMRPDMFVGIELRRVRRQVEELEPSFQAVDVGANQLGLVNRMPVDDDEDRLVGADHQPLEELAKHRGGDRAFVEHEAKLALRAHRRNHVQREAPAGHFDHRRLPTGRPRRAGMERIPDSSAK